MNVLDRKTNWYKEHEKMTLFRSEEMGLLVDLVDWFYAVCWYIHCEVDFHTPALGGSAWSKRRDAGLHDASLKRGLSSLPAMLRVASFWSPQAKAMFRCAPVQASEACDSLEQGQGLHTDLSSACAVAWPQDQIVLSLFWWNDVVWRERKD